MVSRRPRMPRVPGAAERSLAADPRTAPQAARGAAPDTTSEGARSADPTATEAKGVKEGEVVELRRAAEAADESVGRDAARSVAEKDPREGTDTGAGPDTSAAKGPRAAEDTPAGDAAEEKSPAEPPSSSSRIAREPDSTVSTLRPGARPGSGGAWPVGARPGPRPGPRAADAGQPGRTRGGSRPAPAPQRRLGPGRTAEHAAQDAARRREPAPKPVPARSVTGRSLVVIAVIFIAATLMAPTLRVYLNQSLEIAAAEQDIQDQRRQKAEYEDRIARWEDEDFVKQQARDRLDLVMPGETLYRVTGQDRLEQVPEEDASTREQPVDEGLPWAEGLWDSVVRAATE
ncbi:septum formation initiator family protein [Micrococcus luteus]